MLLHRRASRALAVSLVAGALVIAAQPAQAASFTEGFDDVSTLTNWRTVNPEPLGGDGRTWEQGEPEAFAAQSGPDSSYIGVSYSSGGDNVSNWLIAPQQTSLSSTDVLTFWTRTLDQSDSVTVYPDRLEVRMSTNGSCNPGTTTEGVGDFTTLLTSINPDQTDDGYPMAWTQYSVPLTGLSAANVSGCLAFRYTITDTNNNGNYIGIDTLSFTDNASVACTTAQSSVTAAQAQATTATAASTAATSALTRATAKLKNATQALKKAKKSKKGDTKAKVAKAKKKVKKAAKVVNAAKATSAAATTAAATAQTALTAANGAVTSSCP
jgi:hypothetical protein